jgi:hypothetical protein
MDTALPVAHELTRAWVPTAGSLTVSSVYTLAPSLSSSAYTTSVPRMWACLCEAGAAGADGRRGRGSGIGASSSDVTDEDDWPAALTADLSSDVFAPALPLRPAFAAAFSLRVRRSHIEGRDLLLALTCAVAAGSVVTNSKGCAREMDDEERGERVRVEADEREDLEALEDLGFGIGARR